MPVKLWRRKSLLINGTLVAVLLGKAAAAVRTCRVLLQPTAPAPSPSPSN